MVIATHNHEEAETFAPFPEARVLNHLHHPEGQVLIGPLQIDSDWLHPFVGITFPINLFENTLDHLAYIGRSKIHLSINVVVIGNVPSHCSTIQ